MNGTASTGGSPPPLARSARTTNAATSSTPSRCTGTPHSPTSRLCHGSTATTEGTPKWLSLIDEIVALVAEFLVAGWAFDLRARFWNLRTHRKQRLKVRLHFDLRVLKGVVTVRTPQHPRR